MNKKEFVIRLLKIGATVWIFDQILNGPKNTEQLRRWIDPTTLRD